MRTTLVLIFLAPCVIAANQPTFSYAVPANTTVTAMTVDAAGNTYLTGSTTSSTFPAFASALQTQFNGGTCEVIPGLHGVPLTLPCSDAFVIKLPCGQSRIRDLFRRQRKRNSRERHLRRRERECLPWRPHRSKYCWSSFDPSWRTLISQRRRAGSTSITSSSSPPHKARIACASVS